MSKPLLAICSLSLAASAPWLPSLSAETKATPPACATQTADPAIDDHHLKSTFETALGKLRDEEKTRPAEDLIKELRERATHPLRLATTPHAGPQISRAEIYRRSLKSSLIFGHIYKCDKCSKWHGNVAGGFILTPDGLAVTNFHVINSPKAAAFGAMTADGKIYPVAEILAASEADDVAIFRLEGAADLTPLPVSVAAKPGEEVTVVSHPSGLFYSLTQGVVSRYSVLKPNPGARPVPSLEITADYAAGSSGSPIFDSLGNVIGLVKSTRSLYYNEGKDGTKENLQMVIKTCVPASSILRLLDSDAPKDPSSPRTP
jgi:serine protease Do